MISDLNRMRFALCCVAAFVSACATEEGPSPDRAVELASPAVAPDRDSVVLEEAAPALSAIFARSARHPRRGVVTAGDIDDGLNLRAFASYQQSTAKRLGLPRANLAHPVLARLVDRRGKPAPGVRVTLSRPGASQPFYDGYSGVDGMVTVFPAIYGAARPGRVEMRIYNETAGLPHVYKLEAGGIRKTVKSWSDQKWQPDFLDLAIVMDTTGSMGDELNWLTKELQGIVNAARASAPGVDIRYALIAYRDDGDAYVVRNFGFTGNSGQMTRWLRSLDAYGGGDYPEAAAQALAAGGALNWRRGKGERLMFHIADAPAHDRDARAYLAAAQMAAKKNVQVFGLGASGVAAESEFLMRQAAVQTGGRYMFLTDDSGVGYPHAEPTISCYRVTKLRDLMVRVLRSELSGHRVEASAGAVIRSVGSYRAGVCRD